MPAAAPRVRPTPSPTFRWFLGSLAAYFAAFGLQGVLFSYLVVFFLAADAAWVGVAQSCLMAPAVLFLLVGGALADRVDRRRLLIGLSLAASALSACLLVAVASGVLTLGLLLAFALAMGTVQAFIIPARDSLLSEVAGTNLGFAVAMTMLTQWGMQALGALAGGSAHFVGIEPAIALHALLILGGVLPLTRLPPSPPALRHESGSRLQELVAGVREVLGSPALLPPFLMVAIVGIAFIGPFSVVFPIMIRTIYGGGVGELGLLNSSFSIGTILGSLLVLQRGGIRRRGRAQLAALAMGALCLGAVGLEISFPALLGAVVLWGSAAAVFMNAGRGIFQEKAPATHRGRVLAVYTLGFMGSSGLVGAPLFGALVDLIGPLRSCQLSAAAVLVTVALAGALTDAARND
jgi:MFS family permease